MTTSRRQFLRYLRDAADEDAGSVVGGEATVEGEPILVLAVPAPTGSSPVWPEALMSGALAEAVCGGGVESGDDRATLR